MLISVVLRPSHLKEMPLAMSNLQKKGTPLLWCLLLFGPPGEAAGEVSPLTPGVNSLRITAEYAQLQIMYRSTKQSSSGYCTL